MSDDIAVRPARFSDAHLLAEVLPAVDELPSDSSSFPLLHDLAVLCERAGFVESSLVLYDRCLRLSLNDEDLQLTYAGLTAACHAAAAAETDPVKRSEHLHDGLYAATAALDPAGARRDGPTCTALAHRAVLLAEVGHHEAAMIDAHRARALAIEHGMRREQVVAGAGEVISRWLSSLDTTVLSLIAEVNILADGLDVDDILRPVNKVEVDALWSLGRRDEARAVLQRHNEALHERLRRRADDRWERVHSAISRVREASALEADALTGLLNRRHLGRWLPEAMSDDVPVCIAALDVDAFGYVNQQFSPEAGDRVLQELAGLLERVCRRGDTVTRVGGNEFVMVLRDASPGDARIVLERVRQLVAARSWSNLPSDVHLSISIGATVGSGSGNSDVLQAIARDALRHAKACGGDQISLR